MGRDLFQLKRYEECEATRRAGAGWAPEVDDPRTRTIRLSIASDLANILISHGKRTEASSVLERADDLARHCLPFEGQAYETLHVWATFT